MGRTSLGCVVAELGAVVVGGPVMGAVQCCVSSVWPGRRLIIGGMGRGAVARRGAWWGRVGWCGGRADVEFAWSQAAMLNSADEPFSLFTMGDALDGYDKEEAPRCAVRADTR